MKYIFVIVLWIYSYASSAQSDCHVETQHTGDGGIDDWSAIGSEPHELPPTDDDDLSIDSLRLFFNELKQEIEGPDVVQEEIDEAKKILKLVPELLGDSIVNLISNNLNSMAADNNLAAISPQVTLFPNPNDGKFKVKLVIPECSEITIKLYDLLNNLIATIADNYFSSGTQLVDFDNKSLASGMYFVKISGQDIDVRRRIIIK
jgi:hypothetical protein